MSPFAAFKAALAALRLNALRSFLAMLGVFAEFATNLQRERQLEGSLWRGFLDCSGGRRRMMKLVPTFIKA